MVNKITCVLFIIPAVLAIGLAAGAGTIFI